jgi:hypothetical protein
MAAIGNDAFLDRLIQDQRKAIRFYVMFAAALVTVGVVVIIFAFLSPILFAESSVIPDTFKGFFGLGGAFVSSLSTFQFKEVLNRREKIHAFETIKMQMLSLQATPKSKRGEAEKRLEELVWKVLEKTALS